MLLNASFLVPVAAVDEWVPGENSIIDTRDFDSSKELADFLLSLNEDDEAYNRYFEWKKNPWPPRFQTLLDNCVFFAECRLCQALAGAKGELAEAANGTTQLMATDRMAGTDAPHRVACSYARAQGHH